MNIKIAVLTSLLFCLFIGSAYAVSGLRIKCDQEGAEIFLNDKSYGQCPKNITAPAGNYKVVLKKSLEDKSYWYYETQMKLSDNAVEKLEAKLERVYPEVFYYKKAKKSNSAADYQEYLTKAPNGSHADEVKQTLSTMEESLYGKTKEGKGRTACRDYLGAFPEGKYIAEVKEACKSQRAEIEGWDKAKFGMSLSEIKSIYPTGNTTIDITASEECSKLAGQPWPPGILSEKSVYSCNVYELRDYSVGFDKVMVTFRFSERDETLQRIEVLSPLMSSGYLSYIKLLKESYGDGIEQKTYNAKQGCEEIRRKLANRERFYFFDRFGIADKTTWKVASGSRTIQVELNQYAGCPLNDDGSAFTRSWNKPIDDSLKLTYTDQ